MPFMTQVYTKDGTIVLRSQQSPVRTTRQFSEIFKVKTCYEAFQTQMSEAKRILQRAKLKFSHLEERF